MLKEICLKEALPESVGPERPVFGVGTEEDENGESDENERPMTRPAKIFRARSDGENADDEDNKSGPVVVVFGPRFALRCFGLKRGRARNVGRWASRLLRFLLEQLTVRCLQLRNIGTGKARPARRVAALDLGRGQAVIRKIDGGRLRRE